MRTPAKRNLRVSFTFLDVEEENQCAFENAVKAVLDSDVDEDKK